MSSENRQFKAGESFDCSACGQPSLVKIATKMDGWTPIGKYFVCALCSAELAPVATCPGTAAEPPGTASISRLADFLAEKPKTAQPADQLLGVAEDLERFCKNCRHFYKHPFMDRCLLHQRPTGPMDDCQDFELKSPEENQ